MSRRILNVLAQFQISWQLFPFQSVKTDYERTLRVCAERAESGILPPFQRRTRLLSFSNERGTNRDRSSRSAELGFHVRQGRFPLDSLVVDWASPCIPAEHRARS